MSTIQFAANLFFHSLIIISVYERLKCLLNAIKNKDKKAIKGEFFILLLICIISVLLYKFIIIDMIHNKMK
jgi:hypothetical protein